MRIHRNSYDLIDLKQVVNCLNFSIFSEDSQITELKDENDNRCELLKF